MDIERFVVEKIDRLRCERGWSVYRLSQESGINAQTIHDWKNKGAVPKVRFISDVCEAFGITVADFFADGNLVELTDDKKSLLADWTALSKSKQQAVKSIINSFKE